MPTNHAFRTPVAAALSALALLVGFVAVAESGQAAVAAASDVRLAGADCSGDPEVIEVKNFGDEGHDLSGWHLQSESDAPFDLTPFGTLPAGGSIFVESGPNAQATFRWSQSEILRDNDPSDYVRLVDNLGATRGEIACGQAVATPTPTPTPTASAGGVPNGGGPPAEGIGVLSPAELIYAGGSMVGAVVGLAFAWLGINVGLGRCRRRSAAAAVEAAGHGGSTLAAAPQPATAPTAASEAARTWSQPDTATQPLLMALVVALGAAILVALMLQSQNSTRRR